MLCILFPFRSGYGRWRGKRRKKMCTAQYPDPGRDIYDWFVHACVAGKSVPGYLITTQAAALHKQVRVDDFEQPSVNWLNRWKQHHGVNLVKQSGESKVADVTGTEFRSSWKKEDMARKRSTPALTQSCFARAFLTILWRYKLKRIGTTGKKS